MALVFFLSLFSRYFIMNSRFSSSRALHHSRYSFRRCTRSSRYFFWYRRWYSRTFSLCVSRYFFWYSRTFSRLASWYWVSPIFSRFFSRYLLWALRSFYRFFSWYFFFPPSLFLVVLSDITDCTLYVFSGSFHDIVYAGSRFLPGVFHNTLFFLSSGVLVNDGLHHILRFLDVFSMVGYWAFWICASN